MSYRLLGTGCSSGRCGGMVHQQGQAPDVEFRWRSGGPGRCGQAKESTPDDVGERVAFMDTGYRHHRIPILDGVRAYRSRCVGLCESQVEVHGEHGSAGGRLALTWLAAPLVDHSDLVPASTCPRTRLRPLRRRTGDSGPRNGLQSSVPKLEATMRRPCRRPWSPSLRSGHQRAHRWLRWLGLPGGDHLGEGHLEQLRIRQHDGEELVPRCQV